VPAFPARLGSCTLHTCTGSSQAGEPPAIRAVLPWLLVATVPPTQEAITATAVNFGVMRVAALPVAVAPSGYPCLADARLPGSDLDHFAGCLCAVHRAALSIGLTRRASRANAGSVVLVEAAAAGMTAAVVTLLATYLHLFGRLSLAESSMWLEHVFEAPVDTVLSPPQVARPILGLLKAMAVSWLRGWLASCQPKASAPVVLDSHARRTAQVAVDRITTKLMREASLRPYNHSLSWPYGGSHVSILIHSESDAPQGTGDKGTSLTGTDTLAIKRPEVGGRMPQWLKVASQRILLEPAPSGLLPISLRVWQLSHLLCCYMAVMPLAETPELRPPRCCTGSGMRC
jgi:hypothetical protein